MTIIEQTVTPYHTAENCDYVREVHIPKLGVPNGLREYTALCTVVAEPPKADFFADTEKNAGAVMR